MILTWYLRLQIGVLDPVRALLLHVSSLCLGAALAARCWRTVTTVQPGHASAAALLFELSHASPDPKQEPSPPRKGAPDHHDHDH